jgi:alanine racemase
VKSKLRLVVDLQAIRSNLEVIRSQLARHCRIIWVVKSNAYGIGLECVARLHGCVSMVAAEDFAAASRLLQAAPSARVLVLYPLDPACCPASLISSIAAGQVVPTVDRREQVEAWGRRRAAAGAGRFAVQVSVALPGGRFGADRDQTRQIVRAAAREDVVIQALFAHPTRSVRMPLAALQAECERFGQLARDEAGDVPVHFADSAAAMRGVGLDLDYVRTGLLPLGVPPVEPNGVWADLRVAFTLLAEVIRVKAVRHAETIGYSGDHGEPASHVAIAGFGHADGLPRAIARVGHVFWRGRELPYAADTWMEMSPLWVGQADVGVAGEQVEVIGPHVPPHELAAGTDMIPEEFFVNLSADIPRQCRGGEEGRPD